MGRILAFIYGLVSYLIFLAAFLYAIAFVGGFYVPKTINSGEPGAFLPSLFINIALLGLFAVQHSGMARPGFKRWWTKIIPKPIERSTYVLLSSGVLILLMWQWQPMTGIVWSVESEWGRWILWGLFGLGWLLVLASTYMISHAHLFGLTQVYNFLKRRGLSGPKFQTPGFYRYVRHPLMLGFFIAFWATPEMTVGHLLFSGATTGYILIALQLEERDLIQTFGDKYRQYREQVPMIMPWPGRKATIKKHENID
ncbi:MAG: methanethiol S-methyltransferase [Candidatus Halalkalibacterium sp. M3_1C_030]